MHQVNIIRALNPAALFNVGRAENPKRGKGRRKKNQAERNPSPGTWLLIMGGTAVAVGGAVALLAKRDKPYGGGGTVPGGGTTPGGGGTKPGGGGGGGGGGTKHGSYVGDPKGYLSWPHQDMFPDESGFGDALERLGYTVGDWSLPVCVSPKYTGCFSVINNPTYSAIKKFQRDWNIYRANISEPWAPQLSSDGLLGPNSINALAGVMEAVDNLGLDWESTIADLSNNS